MRSTQRVDHEMSSDFEVLPVTSDEALLILGSLNMDEVENLLDDISIMRRNGLFEKTMMFASGRYLLKIPPIVSR